MMVDAKILQFCLLGQRSMTIMFITFTCFISNSVIHRVHYGINNRYRRWVIIWSLKEVSILSVNVILGVGSSPPGYKGIFFSFF